MRCFLKRGNTTLIEINMATGWSFGQFYTFFVSRINSLPEIDYNLTAMDLLPVMSVTYSKLLQSHWI
jgi:hypothetical protein